MAKNILNQSKGEDAPDSERTSKGNKKKDLKKVKKAEKIKGKKDTKKTSKKKKKSSSSSSSSSASKGSKDSSSSSASDPEQVMSSLALQLNLSQNMLKLKDKKVMKIEDLTAEQIQFIISHPTGCHHDLPELATFTLHECGGELYQMRKQATLRLQGKVSKRKHLQDEGVRTQAQAEEACKMAWKKRVLEIYELFG